MPVYMIRAGGNGPVKIGFSQHSARRLQTLQVGNPERLDLIREVPGDERAELWFHHEFKEFHITGEWFRFHHDMLTALPGSDELCEKIPRNISDVLWTHHYECGLLTARGIESRAKERDLPIAEVCRRANVAQSTFHRWKTGESGLTIGTYVKLLDVIHGAESAPTETDSQP